MSELASGTMELHEVTYPDDLRHVRNTLTLLERSELCEGMPELQGDARESIDRIGQYLED